MRLTVLYSHITETIGNTPLLKLDPGVHGLKNIDLYAKLEYMNPFGSVKDRTVWGMLQPDITKLSPNQTIVEASSGNTGKALQAIAASFGIPVTVFANRIKIPEIRKLLQLMGTRIEEFPGVSECPDPSTPNDIFTAIGAMVRDQPEHYYYPSQYTNERNPTIHSQTTGEEIKRDLPKVDFLIGGLGTSGSTKGIANVLKITNPDLASIGIVAGDNDFIPGIRSSSELWEVGLFDKSFYETIKTVDSADAIDGTLELIRRYGVLAGPTTGAAYWGALDYLRGIDETMSGRKAAVFLACDRIEPYISYFEQRRPELFSDRTADPAFSNLAKYRADSNHGVLYLSEFDEWRQQDNTLIIDTRSHPAYRIGHIPGAINIDEDSLETMLRGRFPFSISTKLLIVCPIGKKSSRIQQILENKGYQAKSLDEGVNGWRAAGRILEVSLNDSRTGS